MISKTVVAVLSLLIVGTAVSQSACGQDAKRVQLTGQVDRSGYGLEHTGYIPPDAHSGNNPYGGPNGHSGPKNNGRPDWVPPDAYTNSQMVMDSYMRVRGGRVPVKVTEGIFNLEGSIACFWSSSHNYPACQVYMKPMWKHPGDFTFSTPSNPDGPKGWIQDIGTSAEGFPTYRFWYSHAAMSPESIDRAHEISPASYGQGSHSYTPGLYRY